MPRLLCVEDSKAMRRGFEVKVSQTFGSDVSIIMSPTLLDATAELMSSRFDLVILDYYMGYGTSDKLEGMLDSYNVPYAYYTSSPEDIEPKEGRVILDKSDANSVLDWIRTTIENLEALVDG